MANPKRQTESLPAGLPAESFRAEIERRLIEASQRHPPDAYRFEQATHRADWDAAAPPVVQSDRTAATPRSSEGAELALLQARIDELLKSTSWRVTSPLRAVSTVVRGLRVRFGR